MKLRYKETWNAVYFELVARCMNSIWTEPNRRILVLSSERCYEIASFTTHVAMFHGHGEVDVAAWLYVARATNRESIAWRNFRWTTNINEAQYHISVCRGPISCPTAYLFIWTEENRIDLSAFFFKAELIWVLAGAATTQPIQHLQPATTTPTLRQ